MGLLSKPVFGNAVTPPQRLDGKSTPQRGPFALSNTSVESNLKASIFWSDDWKTRHAIYVDYCWKALWVMSSLGLHRTLRGRLALKAKRKLGHLDDQEFSPIFDPATLFFNRIQWIKTVKMMMVLWKSAWVCSALVLPLSFTLLQVNGVITNTFGRTSALMSIVFSSAGILSSGIYVSGKLDFNHKEMERKRQTASILQPETSQSVEFWASIALPMSPLLWSILCFISAIVTIDWIHSSRESTSALESRSTFSMSAIALTSLILVCAIQLLRAMKTFSRV